MSKKTKKMNTFQKGFSKGYAHAVANLIKMGCTLSEVRDLYRANFLSLKELEEIGVDEYDIYILKPRIAEIERLEKVSK